MVMTTRRTCRCREQHRRKKKKEESGVFLVGMPSEYYLVESPTIVRLVTVRPSVRAAMHFFTT
ncbi:hypothetical protein J6590_036673 [Homalodisca vitripennis]|nr:hypothetical protein J6590_036673 [Homalodisca vitripennis]